jgi:hypothetical protein
MTDGGANPFVEIAKNGDHFGKHLHCAGPLASSYLNIDGLYDLSPLLDFCLEQGCDFGGRK